MMAPLRLERHDLAVEDHALGRRLRRAPRAGATRSGNAPPNGVERPREERDAGARLGHAVERLPEPPTGRRDRARRGPARGCRRTCPRRRTAAGSAGRPPRPASASRPRRVSASMNVIGWNSAKRASASRSWRASTRRLADVARQHVRALATVRTLRPYSRASADSTPPSPHPDPQVAREQLDEEPRLLGRQRAPASPRRGPSWPSCPRVSATSSKKRLGLERSSASELGGRTARRARPPATSPGSPRRTSGGAQVVRARRPSRRDRRPEERGEADAHRPLSVSGKTRPAAQRAARRGRRRPASAEERAEPVGLVVAAGEARRRRRARGEGGERCEGSVIGPVVGRPRVRPLSRAGDGRRPDSRRAAHRSSGRSRRRAAHSASGGRRSCAGGPA